MSDISRRNLLKSAALGAASLSTLGVLSACASEPKQQATAKESTEAGQDSTYMAEVLEPTKMPDASGSNFELVNDSKTVVGTTYENLMSAIMGETGASAKYAAYEKVAAKEGFDQIARLFRCTSDAEKIHIELEYNLAKKMKPETQKPEPPVVEEHASGVNLIHGALGEIYETSDMYPAFIKAAQAEGETEAVQVFTRAKLAESYHAEHYMDAYSTIDMPTDAPYYLCPVCGYIHKGENFTACPICLMPKSSFTKY